MSAPEPADELEGVVVTIQDVRRAGFCVAGTRDWFRGTDLDFKAFLDSGLPAADLLATGRPEAAEVVRRVLAPEPDLAGLTITINDVRKAGHCVSGAREWFRLKGLDFRDFLKNGMPAADFVATEDPYAIEIVRKMLDRR